MKYKKPIACLIVDDEVSSQRVLQHFVADTNILDLKGTYSSTSDAFKHLQIHGDIDLLFLDINMPKQSGLDFYKALKNPPEVIFTTAYTQYAVDGFEVNAVDYLLKPIAYERFLTAVGKVRSHQNIKVLEDDFIVLKENKALHKILFTEIQYVEGFGDYVKVHTEEKTLITHSTFSKLLESLPSYFLRVHKSFCINLKKMNHLSGNQIMVDEHVIPVGLTYKQNVLKALNLH